MTDDPFDLQRFVAAQAGAYPEALAELRRGRKTSHWIWFVLPQLHGLGFSSMSRRYGITGLAEARAYLAHPVLGPRLLECIDALRAHPGATAGSMLGGIDAMKFHSCLTLFARAAPDAAPFADGLQRFYGGRPDPNTDALLADGR